jgi:glutamyl-tRNA reductase
MCRYLAQRLPERGFQVAIANRTAAKAELLGAPVVPLEELQRDPKGFDALVSATASPRPLFTLSAWERLNRAPLRLLDLALPHDTEPALGQLPWVHRVDLSSFLAETDAAKAQRFEAARRAGPFLTGAVARLRKRAGERDHKYNTRTAQDRLGEAWNALEEEALLQLEGLDAAEREILLGILKRGRTLSYRALTLEARPAHPHHP